MVKKIRFSFLLFILVAALTTNLSAQTGCSVAYINSTELLELIPGKVEASNAIKQLNQKYKDELKFMQNDYNSKYTDFLSNQNNLAESIKLRRMQELYELEQNISRFMKIAQEDIESQEAQLIAPLRDKLSSIVSQLGIEHGYTCIYDKTNPTLVFISPDAVDATPFVKTRLKTLK